MDKVKLIKIQIFIQVQVTLSGEFGIVYKGLIVKDMVTDVVAIKTLKGTVSCMNYIVTV